jgi:hypothetical protein
MKPPFNKDQMQALAELTAEILREIDARISAVPHVRHCGVWKEGKRYRAGSLVTHQGGLWLVTKSTKERCGQSSAFQLVVKSGSAA